MPKIPAGPPIRNITPLGTILSFILLSAAVLLFRIPENITAIFFLACFFLPALLNPINGIAFIVLSIPFFLGAPHKPYFYLFEILVYGCLIIGYLHLWKRKIPIEIPYKSLIILFTLSCLFSLPINSKEYYYELWATPWKDIGFQWLTGHEKFSFFPLRVLFNYLSGILLFILTANLFSITNYEDLEKILKGLVWMAIGVCLVGFLFLFKIIPSQGNSYLSLSLAGIHEGAISAFAFNRQYLAQYLLILFPFGFYFFRSSPKGRWDRLAWLFALVTLVVALAASMQRSAYLILFLEVFILTLLAIRKNKAYWGILLPLVILGGMFLMDTLFLNQQFLHKLLSLGVTDPNDRRIHLWDTAWRMFFFSPFLGVGLGKYFNLFPEFFKDKLEVWSTYRFVRGEPHSFYFQILAEQGALGFLLFLGLLTIVIYQLWMKAKNTPSMENKFLIQVLAVSLLAWLTLGIFNNVSYVRSLGIFLWVLLGWSVSLIHQPNLSGKGLFRSKLFGAGLVILTAALIYQIKIIHDRPLSPTFQTGFYNREALTGGGKFHWMGKRAVLNAKVQDGAVLLRLSAPLPGIEQHPQRVRFWTDRHLSQILIKDREWHECRIPVDREITGSVVLKIEADYTFNPRKAGRSNDDRNFGVKIRADD